jgi:hypothetical protein
VAHDHRPAQCVRILGDPGPPRGDQLLAVQDEPLLDTLDDLLERRLELLGAEGPLELGLGCGRARERELALDAVELEALAVVVFRPRVPRRAVARPDPFEHGVDPLDRRQVVAVDDEVEIGVEIRLAGGGGADDEDRPRRDLLDHDARDAAGDAAQVVGRSLSGHA